MFYINSTRLDRDRALIHYKYYFYLFSNRFQYIKKWTKFRNYFMYIFWKICFKVFDKSLFELFYFFYENSSNISFNIKH